MVLGTKITYKAVMCVNPTKNITLQVERTVCGRKLSEINILQFNQRKCLIVPDKKNSYIPLNHMAKSKKCNKSENVKTGQFIKTTNHYTLLTKVSADNEGTIGTIPVIVNGDISTEGSIKVTNRNASHKEDSENDETKPKKRQIIIIGDSHTRGCAHEISNYLGKEFEVN